MRRAVTLDSAYALAWTGLADAYGLSIPTEYAVPGLSEDSLLTWAERAARRAIALNPKLGEAYISLGNLLGERGQTAEANAAFAEGIRLSPNYATGHQWYSYSRASANRLDEAVREMEAAHRLDPLSHVITLSLALTYDGDDRFAEATPLFAQGLAQSPEAWYAWGGKVGHELALGRVDEAVLAYKRWLTGMGDDTVRASRLAQELRDPASRSRAIERMVQAGDVHSAVAFTRWQSGDDAVIALLGRMSSIGRGPTPWLLLNGVLGPKLRSDPRVPPLVAKLRAASATK